MSGKRISTKDLETLRQEYDDSPLTDEEDQGAAIPVNSINRFKQSLNEWTPADKNQEQLKFLAEKLIRKLTVYVKKHPIDHIIPDTLKNVSELIKPMVPTSHASADSSESDSSGENNHLSNFDKTTPTYSTLIFNVRQNARSFAKKQNGQVIAGLLNTIASVALNIAAIAVVVFSAGTLTPLAVGLAAGGITLGATGLGLLFSSRRIGKTLRDISEQASSIHSKNRQR